MGDDWADEVEQGDMYGAVPKGLSGEIMRDVYTLCTEMEMHSGAAAFAQTFVYNCIEIVQNLDGDAHDDLVALSYDMGLDFSHAVRLDTRRIERRLGDLIPEGALSVKGIAAAVTAAVIAISFFAQGTRPHIEYHIREVFPGQTYLQHAIQHVRHWAGTRQPTE
jgi:hypothetical protein